MNLVRATRHETRNMKTYKEALDHLNSLTNYERTGFAPGTKVFDLDKLRRILKRLGDPRTGYRRIHVAGTKGKGSICSFTSSILKESGYRTGLFTSPHLDDVRERIKIDGENITGDDFAEVLGILENYIAGEELTYFEVCTLMAVLHFGMKKVDFAVFETGLGGRWDATNIVDAEVCGISPVSYDHTDILGSELEDIAREKAAIVKKGSACVSSAQREEVLDVIGERCAEVDASLALVGKDITYEVRDIGQEGSSFSVYGRENTYEECRTEMPGRFQVANCAAAVGICEKALKSSADAVRFKKGIRSAFIPGRMEVLYRRPLVVIDGAQNGDSAMQLKYSVEQIFKYDRLVLLLGLSKDKDIKSVCHWLAPIADEIVLTRASVSRAADPDIIRGYIKGKPVSVTGDVKEALGTAFRLAGRDDMILATGSFFVAGEVRNLLMTKVIR